MDLQALVSTILSFELWMENGAGLQETVWRLRHAGE
jgi:hypothetical protein